MTAIDNVKAHWAAVSAMRELEVPEWDLTIHYRPMTVGERGEFVKMAEARGETEAGIALMIRKARDADGKPLFDKGDGADLRRHCDSSVFTMVVAALAAPPPSIETLEKN